MGNESRMIRLNKTIDLDELGSRITSWMVRNHEFNIDFKGKDGDVYIISLSKNNLLRQLSGLVYTFKISLEQDDSGMIIANVDDGNLKNQIASLGLGIFFAWPLLLTSGWGIYAKGQFRTEILSKIDRTAHDLEN